MTNLPTIAIKAGTHPGRDYAAHCVQSGHVPGVLSGAELEGKARYFGARYRDSRDRLAAWLESRYGVTDDLVLADVGGVRRWVRVWVNSRTAEPVRLVLEY